MEKILIVGLGNPDKTGTRHNFGIDVVRAFVERMQEQGKLMSDWKAEAEFESQVAKVAVVGGEVVCLFPATYMNDSGRAVAKYIGYFHITLDNILVVHDELELPLGEIALQAGGSARGHNGVRSLEASVGSPAFERLRLGIGRPTGEEAIDRYVLEPFRDEEQLGVATVIPLAADKILAFTVRRLQG